MPGTSTASMEFIMIGAPVKQLFDVVGDVNDSCDDIDGSDLGTAKNHFEK